jgi:hypothetical protein
VSMWRRIPGFTAYEVSSTGVVRHGDRVCAQRVVRSGYAAVAIRDDSGEWRHPYVHQLVLTAFVCPRPEGREAAHSNGCRTDNRVENLQWLTRVENHRHKYAHGTDPKTIAARMPWTRPRGERQHSAKLTADGVRDARARYAAGGLTITAIAKQLGVAFSTAALMLRGETWKHIEAR